MEKQKFDYGMIGLGTMGRNLAFNMNEQGYSVAGFDKDVKQVAAFEKEGKESHVFATADLDVFVKAIQAPRTIILLVPAGKIVDAVIAELKPLLSNEDLLMDCGNSHFSDTDRRIEGLKSSGIHFMGVGISGGESGARYGPSIMPGGPKKVYERVKNMLEALSAKAAGEPCVTWLGPGSAGHYVKMVHNGIEYGIMQLIAETYHLLKIRGKLSNEALHGLFARWNKGVVQSFLVEITAVVFSQKDELSTDALIDRILDRAEQNGTGGWTSEDAMALQVATPVIEAAVSMRALSMNKKERVAAQKILSGPEKEDKDRTEWTDCLEQALYFSMIVTYAQGFALLKAASEKYKYDLNPDAIAKIWRGGCIIRAALLEDIYAAFERQPELSNLMMDDRFAVVLSQAQGFLRTIVKEGAGSGIPLPAMMAALSYYDSYRSAWLPANLIQALRDDFGAHTYERTDRTGIFHTHWGSKKNK